MPPFALWLAAPLAPVLVYSVTQRFSPRHLAAATGLAIGLVLLPLIQSFVFLLMFFRLVLMSGKIHGTAGSDEVQVQPVLMTRENVDSAEILRILNLSWWSPQ